MSADDVNPNLILPVGTRIVTRIEVKTDAARALRPVGAVADGLDGPGSDTDRRGIYLPPAEVARLRGALEAAGASSTLAEEPTARAALHDLLLRVRLGKR